MLMIGECGQLTNEEHVLSSNYVTAETFYKGLCLSRGSFICVVGFLVDSYFRFQAGVLWHLLSFVFNYDYTLEEGGVESSAETNQQVSL